MTVRFVKTQVLPHGLAPADQGDALRMVEVCGRTAYKSEEKIREDSARSFVVKLKELRHLSVLEHSNIVLKIEPGSGLQETAGSIRSIEGFTEGLVKVLKERNVYHRVYPLWDGTSQGVAVAGNFRSWVETLEYLKEIDSFLYELFSRCLGRFHPHLFGSDGPKGNDIPFRVSTMAEAEQLEVLKRDRSSDLPVFVFKFICDRGITHEVVRHRVFSFTQESTRYVNYRNAGMVLVLPEELYPFYDADKEELTRGGPLVDLWLGRAKALFDWYLEDLGRGLKPQIARDILPNLLKSEIFVSGRWSGWKHFIELRDSPKAHPRIRDLAGEVRKYFESIGLSVT